MIPSFHAHIYYDDNSRAAAAVVREALFEQFQVQLGRWHDDPIGPHPRSMYQVAFKQDQFPQVVQWLMLNRQDLTIFVHPETGDDLADHREHAIWMGALLPLKFEAFGA